MGGYRTYKHFSEYSTKMQWPEPEERRNSCRDNKISCSYVIKRSDTPLFSDDFLPLF
jgi:hypothetical protein